MDTTAYLRSQGWLGAGHALNASSTCQGGISKPILIPQKQNLLGVGKKQHDTHADQWWARAFDNVLETINGSSSVKKENEVQAKEGHVEKSQAFGSWAGEKRWGLYGNFVKGEGLKGTLLESVSNIERLETSKAENEAEGVLEIEPGPKRKRRKEEARVPSNGAMMHSVSDQQISTGRDRTREKERESKEERRSRREERRARRKARREAKAAPCKHDHSALQSSTEETHNVASFHRKERQENEESRLMAVALKPASTIMSKHTTKKKKKQKRRGEDKG